MFADANYVVDIALYTKIVRKVLNLLYGGQFSPNESKLCC